MRLIDADALYERACELEAQALAHVGKIINDETKVEEWKIWSAILAERTAFKHDVFDAPTIEPEPHWIPCSERLPEEDHWLGGSGRQFSENVMVTIVNNSDEDTWVDMTYTIDGEWACELPKYCKIVAWKPLPEPYQEGEGC